jgi:hypothetical protein
MLRTKGVRIAHSLATSGRRDLSGPQSFTMGGAGWASRSALVRKESRAMLTPPPLTRRRRAGRTKPL